MEPRNLTPAVMRRLRPLAGSYRYYPYTTKGMVSGKKEMKEEVVRLGVELSLRVAQAMFLLCDDTRKMLVFCARLFRDVTLRNAVLDKLLLVMHYVYFENIKPMKEKDDCGNFDDQDRVDRVLALIPTAWRDFGLPAAPPILPPLPSALPPSSPLPPSSTLPPVAPPTLPPTALPNSL
ncbi:unnamed protein product [Microthlaspi erraticum]|uniref:Uncharacterized protein n=1 Tax=Microthlaspi erraticum TaxID=1685480 RepID=A0A6D2KXD8_9BRAS|nr:unnamed protein product [Microthlaspi erraticum]